MGQSFTGGQLRCAIRRVASHTRACTGTRASVVQHGVCEPRETHHCLAKQLRAATIATTTMGMGREGQATQSDEPDGEADDDGDATAPIPEAMTATMPMQ